MTGFHGRDAKHFVGLNDEFESDDEVEARPKFASLKRQAQYGKADREF